jgi:hypothetical protein
MTNEVKKVVIDSVPDKLFEPGYDFVPSEHMHVVLSLQKNSPDERKRRMELARKAVESGEAELPPEIPAEFR